MTNESKPQTLTLNKEFRHAYYQGKSRATPYFICYMVRGQSGQIRYGITTSKKIGNAVKRNHARRLIRAAFWSVMDQAPSGKDYVFVAREGVLTAKSYQVAAAMKKCLQNLSQPGNDAGRKDKNRRTTAPKKSGQAGKND